MADFLGFLGPVRDVLGTAGGVASVAAAFGAGRDRRTEKALRAQAERATQLSEALTNPNSPLFQSMASDALQQQRTARLQGISDFVREQERQARRFPSSSGNAGFYARNPRRDEAIARAMMLAGQNEQAQANQQARQTLSAGLGALGSSMNALGTAGRVQSEGQTARAIGLPSALFGAERMLGRVQSRFGEKPKEETQTLRTSMNPFLDVYGNNPMYEGRMGRGV
jgi:hypothetical protein